MENTESSRKALGEAIDVMRLNTGDDQAQADPGNTPKPPKRELTEEELAKKKERMEAGYAIAVSFLVSKE